VERLPSLRSGSFGLRPPSNPYSSAIFLPCHVSNRYLEVAFTYVQARSGCALRRILDCLPFFYFLLCSFLRSQKWDYSLFRGCRRLRSGSSGCALRRILTGLPFFYFLLCSFLRLQKRDYSLFRGCLHLRSGSSGCAIRRILDCLPFFCLFDGL